MYQTLFSISKALRDLFENYNDKVFIGLHSCKIYERFYVKRCYRCQKYGHYIGQCSDEVLCCGKCAGNHKTTDCQVTLEQTDKHRCSNCKLANKPDKHLVSSSSCPIFQEEQIKIKKLISNLN